MGKEEIQNKTSKTKDKSPHAGHRARKKDVALNSPIERFSPHEIMEILLYYSIPQKDTNIIGHNLINKFGSVSKAIDASAEELLEVSGISKNTVCQFDFFRKLAGYYLREKCVSENPKFCEDESLVDFVTSLFFSDLNESFYIIFLDSGHRQMGFEKIADGSVDKVKVDVKKIITSAIKRISHGIIMAHNHPNALNLPSENDIIFTKKIADTFRNIDIKFFDHMIVGSNGVFSFRENYIGEIHFS